MMISLGNGRDSKHLYHLGVCREGGGRVEIKVHANNRAQAGAIARKAGWVVLDVNMVG